MGDTPEAENLTPEELTAAAEWGAAAEAQETDSGRVLNQEEIDSLLGLDTKNQSDMGSGIQSIVNSALVSYERLPMLEVVFDRLVRLMTTSLRNFTSETVEVNLEEVHSARFGDYLDSVPLPAMLAVFKAVEWDNHALIAVDSPLIYSMVDVLLGGRRGTAAMRIEGRPYTTIERNLVERLIRVILNDLGEAFRPLSGVHFQFDRLETNPRFASIAQPANAAIVVRLHIEMDDRGGKVEILIPNATLEPVRELLLQMFMGEKFGRDSIWESHLATELWETGIEVNALLDTITANLGDVMNWQVGSQILLNARPDSDVTLLSGDFPMFRGRMGQRRKNIAIRISDVLYEQNHPTQEISPHVA